MANQENFIVNMGKIIALCISNKKGIQKHEIPDALFIENFGIEGDAHAGNWHRQVSFLDEEEINAFKEKGAEITNGAFGENVIIQGIKINELAVGQWLKCGDVIFEITQKGKECHDHCAIYYKMGECIMPRLGTFAKVIKGGTIKKGDIIEMIEREKPFPFQAAVITLSDAGFRGEREDVSGPTIANRLKEEGYEIVEQILLPDEPKLLQKELMRLCDQRQVDLILTTGGTGFSHRDQTPEATLAVMDRNAPGISEAIRAESLKITPHAMLSRGVSVIRKKTLIINLPGSPKACLESMDVFMKAMPHAIGLLRNEVSNCAKGVKK